MFSFFRGMALCLFVALAAGVQGQSLHAHLPGRVINPVKKHAGSAYFLDEWLLGDVLLRTGEWARDVYLRYDGYHDRLIWLIHEEGNKQVEVEKDLVDAFVLKKEGLRYTFERKMAAVAGDFSGESLFLQVLHEDCAALYVYRRVRLSDRFGQFIDENGRVGKALLLMTDPVYFLAFPGEDIRQVRRNRRSFKGVMSDFLPDSQFRELRGMPSMIRTEPQLTDATVSLSAFLRETGYCK